MKYFATLEKQLKNTFRLCACGKSNNNPNETVKINVCIGTGVYWIAVGNTLPTATGKVLYDAILAFNKLVLPEYQYTMQ